VPPERHALCTYGAGGFILVYVRHYLNIEEDIMHRMMNQLDEFILETSAMSVR